MIQKDITAIILAAGDSSRMGSPKALLLFNKHTFLEIILKNIISCGVENVVVITGKHDQQIRAEVDNRERCILIKNPDAGQGQLSSIHIALQNLPAGCGGILLALVDHPLVQQKTYKIITETAIRYPDHIIIPSCDNKNGHPVYFGAEFFPELLNAPIDSGARAVVYANPNKVRRVPVNDTGILKDIDLPEDYMEISGGSIDSTGE